MQTPYLLERNGPIIAEEMRTLAAPHVATRRFAVVAVHYNRTRSRVWPAATIKQAFRKLGSVTDSGRGKLYQRDAFAACIVTPANRVMNWAEVKAAIRSQPHA